METKVISRHIDRLFLDPNNYRFIDSKEYHKVDEVDISDPRIQQKTFNLLVGKNNDNVSDLITSFKANGILKLDPIQVKTLDDNFLVIEGNRRTAALKFLYSEFKKGNNVGKLTLESFKSIEVVSISGDNPIQHLITMGLHHISGKRKWSPVNQAQLIKDLKYIHGMQEEDICNSLSISKHNLRRNIRVLALIERYKNSDFGDQFEPNMYSLFEEIIKKTEIKSWLGWDDNKLEPTILENEEKLFSWISREEFVDDEGEENQQIIIKEPIITKSHEIRDLSKIITDKKAIDHMERSRNITAGFTFSDAIGETRLHNAIDIIRKETQVAFQFSEYMIERDFITIATLRDKLDKLLPSSRSLISNTERLSQNYFDQINSHFSKIEIYNYRRLENITIEKLSKINIFVGSNNYGKTSFIEAIYLLSQMNNINGFIEVEQYRGKFYNDFHSRWIDRNFTPISIQGDFNSANTSLSISRSVSEDEDIDKLNYISSISFDAEVGDESFNSIVNLYTNREPELYYSKSHSLCYATFTSPFRHNPKLVKNAHAKAIREKYFQDIMDFIRSFLDPNIEKVEMVNIEGDSRFQVSSLKHDNVIDITKYGEGLQRIFEIALLIGYSQNGIICIDEIDSGIHKSLLIDFTEFVQTISKRFNVQVFMTTHSKECIDAFIENTCDNEDLTAYILSDRDGEINCKHVEGKRLERLVENLNLDIR
ncbi:AAA family ATPase [Pedobacter flavus]|uniref:AAA family ATPase n=1 Tax=Pedobacter flavus TaxID=3113906 RepID=A0ABU7GZG5_9SPHI|nr:AAA family ATPase [Pedobacter sp. VNH31]MEE1884376.1 AAA family ATPase [Pedobacter sp. VNH31]